MKLVRTRPFLSVHAAWLATAVVFALASASAADESGTVTLRNTSAAAGIGLAWGSGEIEMEGYDGPIPFSVLGFKLGEVGAAWTKATGTVHDLEDVSDFEGSYWALEGGVAVVAGYTTLSMENENGVRLELTGIPFGARATFATEGINVTLGDLPAVSAPPPPVAAAVAVPVVATTPDPCDRSVIFGGVHFDTGEDGFIGDDKDVLDHVVAKLKNCPTQRITVHGYSDDTGTAAINLEVSKQRAEHTKAYLVEQGIAADRVETMAHGAVDFVGSNETDQGRANNRRAVIRPTS